MNPTTVPGPLLLVLDCPTPEHAAALRDAPAIKALLARLASEAGGGGACAVGVVHLTPPEAARAPAYLEVCAALGPAAYQISATAGSQGAVTCRAAATLQTKLNAVEPTVFPLGAIAAAAAEMGAERPEAGGEQQEGQQQQQQQQSGAGAAAPHLTRLVLAPAKQRGISSADVPPPLELAKLRASLLGAHPRVAALVERFQSARSALHALLAGGRAPEPGAAAAAAAEAAAKVPPELRGIPRDALEVVLLGTVSAKPSSYRNVSSYYLDFFRRGGGLADCGE